MVSKATRRGPMDEMRQLVRILVKIIPHSVTFLASAEEGGGGNRISEERIKYFLDSTLGEAPRPAWGVPQGWGEYLAGEDTPAPTDGPSCSGLKCSKIGLECIRDWNHVHSCEMRGNGSADPSTWRAELFSWVSEQPITREQAMRCAKREPGRSWEAINSEIRKLGV